MNEHLTPNQILIRYSDVLPPKLTEQELAIVQQHLATHSMKSVFGVLPLQTSPRFTDTGFMTREIRNARVRIETDIDQLTAGPYMADGQYYPAGVMLYHTE
jgi:hypothetical protein